MDRCEDNYGLGQLFREGAQNPPAASCFTCNKPFASIGRLRSHNTNQHSRRNIGCDHGPNVFATVTEKEQHITECSYKPAGTKSKKKVKKQRA